MSPCHYAVVMCEPNGAGRGLRGLTRLAPAPRAFLRRWRSCAPWAPSAGRPCRWASGRPRRCAGAVATPTGSRRSAHPACAAARRASPCRWASSPTRGIRSSAALTGVDAVQILAWLAVCTQAQLLLSWERRNCQGADVSCRPGHVELVSFAKSSWLQHLQRASC